MSDLPVTSLACPGCGLLGELRSLERGTVAYPVTVIRVGDEVSVDYTTDELPKTDDESTAFADRIECGACMWEGPLAAFGAPAPFRRWTFVIAADFPADVTRDQIGNVLGDACVMVAEPILERPDDGNDLEGSATILAADVHAAGDVAELRALLDSLPVVHPERPGLVRAIEFLRTLP